MCSATWAPLLRRSIAGRRPDACSATGADGTRPWAGIGGLLLVIRR
ncbi:MYXO-CTERM sorting domain-containing protein [Frankia sp. R43]